MTHSDLENTTIPEELFAALHTSKVVTSHSEWTQIYIIVRSLSHTKYHSGTELDYDGLPNARSLILRNLYKEYKFIPVIKH